MDKLKVIQNIRKKLAEKKVSIGSWMQIPNASLAELLGQAGYDWVAIDLEHGAFSLHQLPDIFRALELNHTLPLVRLSRGNLTECKQVLDAGAGGVIIPMVESAEQLAYIRNACCWPPTGIRGVGFSRANLFGKNFDSYVEEAQAPIVVAMIENIKAVKELPKILQVEGLDAILIGPYDLSASMGLTGQFNHSDFQATIQFINETVLNTRVACGIHVVSPKPEELYQRINAGYQFIAYSIDAVFFHSVIQNPLIYKDE